MAQDEIHKDDIGTVFEVTIKDGSSAIDISSATVTKEITFAPPEGATKVKSAVFKTDGTDGILKYTTIADDLDTAGKWELQAKVVITAGTWYSDIIKFEVKENL